MKDFFSPKKVVVIGASDVKGKIGHTIFSNLLGKKFEVIPVNIGHEKIMGKKCYKSVLDIPFKVDLGIIATPAKTVPVLSEECGRKGIKNVIIISAGFKEVGNKELENKLKEVIDKYKINVIGPNCLGLYDAYSELDTLFMLKDRLHRPGKGKISLISQSGAMGAAILDLAAKRKLGFSKFVSFGNAIDLDETDLLDYIAKDKNTEIICMYVEEIKRGQKFLQIAKKIKKPVIFLKGGTTEAGTKAALSHTGSLAGSSAIYSGVLRQAGFLQVKSIEEMFILADVFEKVKMLPKGKRVQVITNGGGYGINAVDLLEKAGLSLAKLSEQSVAKLKHLPNMASFSNPLDILGDSTDERYNDAIKVCLQDKKNDLLLVLVLTQVPLIDEKLSEAFVSTKKPVIAVVTGTELAEKISSSLKKKGIPCYEQINDAVTAIKGLVEF